MAYEPVKRNRYFAPPQEFPHTSRNHAEDIEEFHRPLSRMHQAHLHGWGIARGLEVNGTLGSAEVSVNAGVAIDSRGELIVLSSSGNIGTNPAGGQHQEVTVPVRLDLSSFAGQTRYVTVQFSEILRLNEGSGGRFEQVPWLRLQSPSDYVDDGSSILLAIVVIGADGKLTELKLQNSELNHHRRLIGETIEALHLQRSIQVGDQIKEVPAGKIAPIEGGLQITAQGGDGEFANLDVQAKRVTLDGSLGIGTDSPITKLHVVANGPRPPLTLANLDGATGIHLVPKSGETWQVGANSQGFFIQDNDTLHLVIQPDGDVGIGTTAPDQKFHVSNGNAIINEAFLGTEPGTGFAIFSHRRSASTKGYGFGQSIDGRFTVVNKKSGGGSLSFRVDNTDKMVINDSGKVGIGTSNPDNLLHVFGSGPVTIQNPNGESDIMFISGNHQTWQVGTNEQGWYVWDKAYRLVVKPGGKVGLGTTEPTHTLDVDGGIRTRAALHVDAFATVERHLEVKGNLLVHGGKGGYVIDQFVNKLGETLEQGDVVVIGENQSSLYYGRDNNIPILEVDVAQSAHNTRVCGIVCEVSTQLEPENSEAIDFSANLATAGETQVGEMSSQAEAIDSKTFMSEELEKFDRTKIEPGQSGWMVTLGAFAHCKVDADIAPIQVGDLLTTSPTKGHAQKVLDSSQAVGAIVGKALGALEKGKGKIPVLVMLH